MNNLKKKKKRYMFIASIQDNNNLISNEMAVAGLAKMIRSVGLATWMESPKEPLKMYKRSDDESSYMDIAITCSTRKEQVHAIQNAFFQHYPEGNLRCLELANC